MNAFELYEIVSEDVSVETRGSFDCPELTVEALQGAYEYNVGGFLSPGIAEKIIAAHKELCKENEKNGKFSSNYYYCIEQPLSEIEL